MANSLVGFLPTAPKAFTATSKYRGTVESLRTYFRNHPETSVIKFSKEELWLCRGDLTTLLKQHNVPVEDHYLVMRVNGLTSIHDVNDDLDVFLIPSSGAILQFKTHYKQSLTR